MSPRVAGQAAFSACGCYRWWLTRTWDTSTEPLVFVMLNPSTATGTADDATTRRCAGFARREGHGGVCVVNLYSLRATRPRELAGAADPVGAETDFWLGVAAARATRVVCAWGADARARPERVGRVLGLLGGHPGLLCLGRTRNGRPRHPLRVRRDQALLGFGIAST